MAVAKEHKEQFDVIVIGGGLAGVCAAIAAARHGCKTALVQDRPVLGGNSSSEIRVGVGGADASFRYARETGILEELRIEDRFRNPIPHKNGRINSIWDNILREWVVREPNLTLFLNARACKAVMKDESTLAAIEAIQTSLERSLHLEADLFIDASGDGMIAADAGAEFRIGREARSEYGEPHAPGEADSVTMGSSLLFEAADVGRPVKFEPPDWAMDFPNDDALPRNHENIDAGYWWIEYGGANLSTIDDNDRIHDDLLKYLFGVWDHIKNHGDHGAENYALSWIGAVPGKRESRRFIGDHVLTENEVLACELFADRIAYGGWPMDLHCPGGIANTREPGAYFYPAPEPYSIPFRCLYSRNIHNLMMAGRNISASRMALGSTRLMGTCAVLGQAAGTAAALCKMHGTTPRGTYETHIRALQQTLLKDDAYIIGLANQDRDDLARSAYVSASSDMPLQVTKADGVHPLTCERGMMFPCTTSLIESIDLLLESSREQDVEIELGIRSGFSRYDFSETHDLGTATGTVPAGKRSWVSFTLNQAVNPDQLYWVRLPAAEGISWAYSSTPEIGLQRAYREKDGWPTPDRPRSWRDMREVYCMRTTPPMRPYGPENVVSGIARPEMMPNIWISDPAKGRPQYVELDFQAEKTIDTVYLTFDTNLDTLVPYGPARECVRDYAILRFSEGNWAPICEVTGNYHRRRVHRFNPVSTSRLRVEIRQTNGAPMARLYEIRVYRER
ncbi:MAG: FAD-dependent oxidoreductase [Planctomycetes bacterium]|nr:FAD-dependent oxidoreductase [Planctomycetota bacterium]